MAGNGQYTDRVAFLSEPFAPNLQDSCPSAVAPVALDKSYQFGLGRNSHMSFAFDDAKVRERLVFRSRRLNGFPHPPPQLEL